MARSIPPPMIIHGNPYHTDPFVRTATYVVAASDAPDHVKAQADYVCDGTADQVELQAAHDALSNYDKLVAFGTFNLASTLVWTKSYTNFECYGELKAAGANPILQLGDLTTPCRFSDLYIKVINGDDRYGTVDGIHVVNLELFSAGLMLATSRNYVRFQELKDCNRGIFFPQNGKRKGECYFHFATLYYCNYNVLFEAPHGAYNDFMEGCQFHGGFIGTAKNGIVANGNAEWGYVEGVVHVSNDPAEPDFVDNTTNGGWVLNVKWIRSDAITLHPNDMLTLVFPSGETGRTGSPKARQYLPAVSYTYPTTFDNILRNASFEVGDPPFGFSLVQGGATAAWSRSAAQVKVGTYSVSLTCQLNFAAYVQQDLDNFVEFRGTTLTLGAWVWADTADRVRVVIRDSVGVGTSAFHPGDSAWHWLTVTRTVDSAAASLQARVIEIIDGAVITAYADGAILVEGAAISQFMPDRGLAVLTKTTTGDPVGAEEGRIIINTFDNRAKIYAEGAWRQFAAW